ncbi:MAG: phospholipid carrier-dependent glycosyltransferase [Spirochaetales bacterium]|nr:phospholipid carrier-dependent glycosyltransferase [Spirochaetales bacterium]
MKKSIFVIFLCVIISLFFISCSVEETKTTTPPQLIKNPSFEEEHSGWVSDWYQRALYEADDNVQYKLIKGDAHSGNNSLSIQNLRPNDSKVYQYISVVPETIYKISCWIKANNITGSVGANIAVLDSGAHSTHLRDTKGAWQQVDLYGMTAPYQSVMPIGIRIGSWAADSEGSALFDDITIEKVITPPPRNITIHSFAFNYNYDDQKAEIYFEKMNDPRYTSQTLHISVFIAFLALMTIICVFLYTFFVKNKLPKMDSILHTTFTQWYALLIGAFFILFFGVYTLSPGIINVLDIQVSLILFFIIGAAICIFLYRYKALTPDNLIKVILLLGIGLRICYFLYTPFTDPLYDRQHDIWGTWSHTDYIKHIANTFSLPPVGTHEAYHPPIHYFLSGIIYKLATLCNLNETYAFRAVQVFLVFVSSLTLLIMYKIFKLIKCDIKVTIFGMAFVCFLPSLIFMSVYLNNDCILAFFYTLSFYYLLKVIDSQSIKHTILLALFTALAVLSKKSAFILFPLCGIVFAIELFKNRKNYKQYIKLGIIFLLIAIPLGFSFQIRNYILFQQGLSYSVPVTAPVMTHNPFHLFYVSIEKLLEHPFPPEDGANRVFLFMELIRTSLFSAFTFRKPLGGFPDVAVILMFAYLVNLVMLLLYFLLSKKADYKGKGYILLINFIISIILYIQMHFSSPYHTTHAFRYLAPFISISFGYFIGQANVKFGEVKFPVLRFIIKVQFVLWCASSAILIYLAGF